MIHHASELIAAAFDEKGIKYGNTIAEAGNSSYVEAGFSVPNSPILMAKFISAGDENDVSLRILLCTVSKDKLGEILIVLNELNRKYRFLKFCLDAGHNIVITFDFPMRISDENLGAVAVEIFLRTMKIMEETYPLIMKALLI